MAGKRAVVVETPVRRADCAVAGCGALTIVREKTQTGWANLCEYHYIQHHHQKSVERCKELGLENVEQMKAFCRHKLKTIFKPMPMSREPGQDDE